MTRYELLDRIGVGGMAEIFRGRAIAGGGFEKPVAIKRILPHLSEDQRFVDMLITEANTLSQLRHRNIVQIFDVGRDPDGQYFLVMEYVQGSDLGALFAQLEKRGKRLPAHLGIHVAAEISDALDFAHRAATADGTPLRLVHRDVSPSNILLSRMGEVKLTDFGIAKRTEEATGHGSVRGKFAYISPEQSRNESVDARSDVFSLGIVMFELLTGRRLFSAMADFDALQAVRQGPIPRPRDVDPDMPLELQNLVHKALEREPNDRYPSAAALGAALREYRYSQLSAAGDPAKELAKILDAVVRQDDGEFAKEPTVLRIETAAGFTGVGLEERIASGNDAFDMFDEEETRALSGEQVRGLATDEKLRPSELPRAESPPVARILEDSPGARSAVEPMSDAPTTLRGVSPGDGPAVDASVSGAVVLRAATPTVRDAFVAGALRVDQRELETEGVHRIEVREHRPRLILLAAIASLIVGVAAFVIAGTLLGDAPAEVDADGAVEDTRVDLPLGEIQTGDEARAAMTDAGVPGAPPQNKRKKKRGKRRDK